MKKAVKGLLKLIGGIMVAAGAVLVVVSYLDELKGLVEKGKALCCRCPALFREQLGGFIFRCSAALCRVVRPYGCEGKFQIVQAGR